MNRIAVRAVFFGAIAVVGRALWVRSRRRALPAPPGREAGDDRAVLKEHSRSNRRWRLAQALGWSFNAG